ncbi:MAG: valine--tRNA ligase, partial [Bacilli bacterium]|nr:valine--tRNA ligase [Bacilli bacterium]
FRSEGRKMSKSLGNGVDPIEVVEEYGADPLRFMLMTGTSPGNDLRFYMDKVENARNFANKIWNAARFVVMNLNADNEQLSLPQLSQLRVADRWILTRLSQTAGEVNRRLDSYDFGGAGTALYEFIWNEYCDWYIEFSKPYLYGDDESAKQQTTAVLVHVLDALLRLLHPFMPFITEELWQHLPGTDAGDTIMRSAYPVQDEAFEDQSSVSKMQVLIDTVREVRAIRVEAGAPPSRKVQILIKPQSEEYAAVFAEGEPYLTRLLNPEFIVSKLNQEPPAKAMTSVIAGAEIFVPLEGLLDVEAEIKRLEKELERLDSEVQRVEHKLANKGFTAKAPQEVIDAERVKGEDYKHKRESIQRRITELRA